MTSLDSTLIISHSDLQQEDSVVLNTAIKLLSLEGVMFRLEDSAPEHAHLLILDDDGQGSRSLLKLSRPGQVKVILSTRHHTGKNVISVVKPLELSSIKSLLKRLFTLMQTQIKKSRQFAENSPQAKPIEPLTDTLFNVLIDTRKQGRVIEVSCDDYPSLYIDGIKHSLATNASQDQLRQIASLALEQLSIRDLSTDNFSVHSNDLTMISLHNFLWSSGIICSQGRLLSGHSIDKPFKLKAWPNFTRHDFKAEYFKLAAILAKNTCSINELQRLSKIPIDDIINFYNAAYAVGIIDDDSITQPTAGSDTRQVPAEKQGLLSRIADRLTLKKYL